ncbi:hypothetical protein SAMN05444008_102409 [Cnuella takakiae]|uniref:Uncharacterized protein n=1 Tax=Cnuella takakiae TaxID=1302690 RepID=A0A1M4VWP5_9BACT|nr:hypothetical protein [Cnuella takakiae]OLY92475.1 hypothetical protein BUE76_11695 [Cnuella takakiae]SHE73386.1 hypothetical protein SAMN05444008_102409 [Cnuella takakiae]
MYHAKHKKATTQELAGRPNTQPSHQDIVMDATDAFLDGEEHLVEQDAEKESYVALMEAERALVESSGFNLLPINKEHLEIYIADCKNQILEGQVDFREALRRKKLMDMVLEQVFKDPEVKRHLEDEYAKHGQKKIMWHGAEISFSSRKSYTYDQCSDSELASLEATAKEADGKLKARQKFLQNLTKPMADPESGELIYPAAFTTTDYFTVSIK